MPHKPIPIKVRDTRVKGYFIVNDQYLNGFAKHISPIASLVYFSLCRHADRIPSPSWHKDILSQREKSVAKGKEKFNDWNKEKERIRKSLT